MSVVMDKTPSPLNNTGDYKKRRRGRSIIIKTIFSHALLYIHFVFGKKMKHGQ